MTISHRIACTLICLAGWLTPAAADWNTSAVAPQPEAAVPESLRLAPGFAATLRLEPVDELLIAQAKQANAEAFNKRLQIGIGRALTGALPKAATNSAWTAVTDGFAAQWEITSPGAQGLRVVLRATGIAPDAQVRFAGNGRVDQVYGPYRAGDLAASFWSPVLEGESAIVEVFVPVIPEAMPFEIEQVSHLFVGPWQANAEGLAKASQSCEVDFICRAASDSALATTGRSVAKMTFGDGTGSASSYLCTGTLLNPLGGALIPYFYSANHCISTQPSASTLTTHWFYDRSACGSGSTGSSYTQLSGGATLRYASSATDALLLQLNGSPPGGAIYAGWDSATVSVGSAVTAVHHPAGDWKKVSLGTIGNFGAPSGSGSSFIVSNWNSTATGVTEGGSSGSGLFTFTGTDYRFRGGLYGGPSSCTAPTSSLYDYYSRFDQVYPAIAQYLNPTTVSCSYTLSPTSITLGPGSTSLTVGISTTAGCAWSVSSNATWLTSASSGSGSGTVSYSVAANSGASRTGTLTIGGIPFNVTQLSGTGGSVNLLLNPGFETGTASWSQSATGLAPIIYEDAAFSRTGTHFAYLGGYNSGTDTLYQEVTIPAGQASLRFWYRIDTDETSTSTAYDTLTVSINSATTGARLATLATLSNLNRTNGYVQSAAYDVSAFAGQTVRLVFQAVMDEADLTDFLVDDIALTSTSTSGGANYTALWWNPNESGWGINVVHEGSILFATLFTYDASGNPLWLVMSGGNQQSGETFSGTLYRTTGPAFNANPFTPIGPGNVTTVGTMTLSFSGGTGTLTYTNNGISVTKAIQKQVYGTRAANCTATSADRSTLTNYQDLWWNPNESGWGVNVTHQDNTLFATLFTYSASGQGIWWVMSGGVRQTDGSYLGTLYQTTGPAFNANPFTPIGPGNITTVGSMRFTFSNGTNGTLNYTVNGVNVTKAITRQVYATTFPACS